MIGRTRHTIAYGVVLGLLVSSALALTVGIGAARVYLKKERVEAPRVLPLIFPETESFIQVGQDQIITPEVEEVLGTDNHVTRSFRHKDSTNPSYFTFHAAYYTGMIDTVPHVPDRCFIGAGMQKASNSVIVPIVLDTDLRSRLRLEENGIPRATPEEYRPIENEDGSRDIYWYRASNTYSARKGAFVRVPFDPRTLRMQVSEFLNADGTLFSGYFFLANGGITPTAEGVRQLAFKLKDKHAYYLKVQFTSSQVGSAEELALLAGEYLDEALGELLLCAPDWVEIQMDEDGL